VNEVHTLRTGRIRNCRPSNPADKTNDPEQIAGDHAPADAPVSAPDPPWPLAVTTPLFDAKMPTLTTNVAPVPLIHQNWR